MITKELLKEFCGQDEAQDFLMEPFTVGEFTYACDARIVVRVPRIEGVNHSRPIPQSLADRIVGFFSRQAESAFVPIPVEPPERWGKPCSVCDGKGRTRNLECDCCGSTLELKQEIICESCEDGSVLCNFPVSFGDQSLNAFYLRKLALLPGVTMANSANISEPLVFKFDGGDGRLMPMKTEGKT